VEVARAGKSIYLQEIVKGATVLRSRRVQLEWSPCPVGSFFPRYALQTPGGNFDNFDRQLKLRVPFGHQSNE
jgi:hypothetical protein